MQLTAEDLDRAGGQIALGVVRRLRLPPYREERLRALTSVSVSGDEFIVECELLGATFQFLWADTPAGWLEAIEEATEQIASDLASDPHWDVHDPTAW